MSHDLSPTQVVQMCDHHGKPMPLLLTFVPSDQRKVVVNIEALSNSSSSGQCCCQYPGHSQANCRAPFRCVKCADPVLKALNLRISHFSRTTS